MLFGWKMWSTQWYVLEKGSTLITFSDYWGYSVCLLWLCHAAFEILVPQPEIQPGLSAVTAQSPQPLDCQGIPYSLFLILPKIWQEIVILKASCNVESETKSMNILYSATLKFIVLLCSFNGPWHISFHSIKIQSFSITTYLTIKAFKATGSWQTDIVDKSFPKFSFHCKVPLSYWQQNWQFPLS